MTIIRLVTTKPESKGEKGAQQVTLWLRGLITLLVILVVGGLSERLGLGAIPTGALVGILIWWFYQGVLPKSRVPKK